MKHPINLATGILVTAALATAIGLGGCAAQPSVKPSAALIYWTPPAPSDRAEPPRFQLTLASGDGVGMQMRDVYLARAQGKTPEATEPVIVLQTEP